MYDGVEILFGGSYHFQGKVFLRHLFFEIFTIHSYKIFLESRSATAKIISTQCALTFSLSPDFGVAYLNVAELTDPQHVKIKGAVNFFCFANFNNSVFNS